MTSKPAKYPAPLPSRNLTPDEYRAVKADIEQKRKAERAAQGLADDERHQIDQLRAALDTIASITGTDLAEDVSDAVGHILSRDAPDDDGRWHTADYDPADYPPAIDDGKGGGRGGASDGGDGGSDGGGERHRPFSGLSILRINPKGEFYYGPNTLLADSPIQALGVDEDHCWFMDPAGMLRALRIKGCGQAELEHLFGAHQEYLIRNWCQATVKVDAATNATSYNVKGFHAQYARQALIEAAHKNGLFEAGDRVRGRGCWRGADGNLIVHAGDGVAVYGDKADGIFHKPGLIGGKVYPARPPVPRATIGAGADLEPLVERWAGLKWERGMADVRLALGWLGTAVLSGALSWRPMIFFIGDAASGKSTLQKEVRAVLEGRIVSTVDASEASLRGLMKQDAIAVSFDEIEADSSDGGKAERVMKLARYAASGDAVYRATSDQKVNEFKLMGGMAFSAISVPPMRPQDKQRFCFLRLIAAPDAGESYRPLGDEEAKRLGQILAGRMIHQWHRWATTLADYRHHLIEEGHSSRGADQFGALLAAWDLILHDRPDLTRVGNVCADYQRRALAEYEDQETNFHHYWRALLAAVPDQWRSGTQKSIGEVLGKWVQTERKKKIGAYLLGDNEAADAAIAVLDLSRAGVCAIVDRANELWLAVPNDHPRTRGLFANTDLARGGWQFALRAGARHDRNSHPDGVWRTQQVVVDGVRTQATLVRLNASVTDVDGSARPIFEIDGNEASNEGADL